MAHIGHHIAADAVYGKRGGSSELPIIVKRQMLHAAKLTITHPSSMGKMTFEAPLAPDFAELLEALRNNHALT